jgi:hypothetical protein
MLVFGMLRLVSWLIECSCMAPLTPAVTVIRGFAFQPLLLILLISGSYLSCLCVQACSGNLSWHWQLVCGHVHFRSHLGLVCSWLILLWVPAFVSV